MGGHGFMGITWKGYALMGGYVAFFAYLQRSFVGPEQPKYQVDPDFAQMAKQYQPGINPEYYYHPKLVKKSDYAQV